MSKDTPITAMINSLRINKMPSIFDVLPHSKIATMSDDDREIWRLKQYAADWRNFATIDTNAHGLAVAIYRGHPFTACFSRRRRYADFLSIKHICLDFDNDGDEITTIEEVATHPLVEEFASFIYTTASHKPSRPRFRVVFVFATEVETVADYKLIATSLLENFDNCDSAATKAPNKIWSGSKDAVPIGIWNVMTVAKMRQLWVRGKELAYRPPPTTSRATHSGDYSNYVKTCFDNAAKVLGACGAGNRNAPLNTEAYKLGRLAGAAWANTSAEDVESFLESVTGGFWGKSEHRHTAQHAISDGMANPADEPRS